MELMVKKCLKCGAMIEVLKDCNCDNCGIKCCGQEMSKLVSNSVDASVEKHKPQVEIIGNNIVVTVPHVMEEQHYIEWIAFVSNKTMTKVNLFPGEVAKVIFPYGKGKVYSYCNLHGLWETEV